MLKMKKMLKKSIILLSTLIVMLSSLVACGKSGSITGTWNREDGEEVLIFEKDGTCSVPFTYSNAWWESCDRYIMDDEETLILSSSQGNISSKEFKKRNSEEEVSENGGYYLSGDTLVIYVEHKATTYKRTK